MNLSVGLSKHSVRIGDLIDFLKSYIWRGKYPRSRGGHDLSRSFCSVAH